MAFVIASAMTTSTAASAQTELAGMYASRGINADGMEYREVVQIVKDGDHFLVRWIAPRVSGEAFLLELTSVGIGIRSGDTLAVSYIAGRAIAIAVYQIGHDGELVGRWTTAGDGEVHSETLTKMPDAAPAEPVTPEPDHAPAPPQHHATPQSSGLSDL